LSGTGSIGNIEKLKEECNTIRVLEDWIEKTNSTRNGSFRRLKRLALDLGVRFETVLLTKDWVNYRNVRRNTGSPVCFTLITQQ
jgi:hypothetical protein